MYLIKPSYEILTDLNRRKILTNIEKAGRTCYKSESKITETSAWKFVRGIIKSGHHSVIEHENISVRFICDRGVTHELVRHRLCAYSQESTRYCNYKGGVTFVIPPWSSIVAGEYTEENSTEWPLYDAMSKEPGMVTWFASMIHAEKWYIHLVRRGWSPQQARSVLPNSLKTEIVTTANLREWRHILTLRCSPAAHPQIREIMQPLLKDFLMILPEIFEGIQNG